MYLYMYMYIVYLTIYYPIMISIVNDNPFYRFSTYSDYLKKNLFDTN